MRYYAKKISTIYKKSLFSKQTKTCLFTLRPRKGEEKRICARRYFLELEKCELLITNWSAIPKQ